MNYELVKKLKDAGFPRKDWHACGSCGEGYGGGKDEITGEITLSELIKACGKDFTQIFHCQEDECQGEWVAYSRPNDKRHEWLNGHGVETPEEAVANLWLALKENR